MTIPSQLTVDQANMFTVMLVQALWGAISPNFRRVAISFEERQWVLAFVLEREDEVDREEIDDAITEFDALAGGHAPAGTTIKTHVDVTAEPLPLLDPAAWRTVFRRREPAEEA